jgi:alpha-L-fucosidase
MAKAKVVPQAERLKWFQEARFGMFIHWGLYAQLGRHEWAMNHEQVPLAEYEKLAATWKPKDRPAREWAALAREAGQKYLVMTTKHHEGFCLWDTRQTDYNAARRGPGRDLVREFVEACREFGLRIGFYYSLMDWHHPDGARCLSDPKARRRFLDFTQGCVRELMTNYGKIDILWYDVPWPLKDPEGWESKKMNAMVRALQPAILINNRSRLPEDFGTPEEQIKAAEPGRAWEACMTFNGSWGYMPSAIDWRSVREVIGMLQTCAGGGGNLLLNIGPAPDGSVPPEALQRLRPVGQWLRAQGEAVYGRLDRCDIRGLPCGSFSQRGKVAYWWVDRWPGKELALGGFKTKLLRASVLATGAPIAFEQTARRIVLRGLPETSPDPIAGVAVLKLEFASRPRREQGAGYVVLKDKKGKIV